MEYAFWNTLHDGFIEAIDGSVPGDVTLIIGIDYLCEKLPTAAKSLYVTLFGCQIFSYTPYGAVAATTDLQSIVIAQPEILSAKPNGTQIDVCCSGGFLSGAYRAVEVRLIEGQLITQMELEDAAGRYWSEWSEQNRKR